MKFTCSGVTKKGGKPKPTAALGGEVLSRDRKTGWFWL